MFYLSYPNLLSAVCYSTNWFFPYSCLVTNLLICTIVIGFERFWYFSIKVYVVCCPIKASYANIYCLVFIVNLLTCSIESLTALLHFAFVFLSSNETLPFFFLLGPQHNSIPTPTSSQWYFGLVRSLILFGPCIGSLSKSSYITDLDWYLEECLNEDNWAIPAE